MKAVVASFNQEKALVGAFSVITNLRMELFEALVDNKDAALMIQDPGLRLTQCSYKIDEDSPSNIFPAQFVSYAVCGVITDLISYALTQQYKTKHNKPWTICRQQKMIHKNVIFSVHILLFSSLIYIPDS